MRPEYPLDDRRITDLHTAVEAEVRRPVAPAPVTAPPAPEAMVLRVYTRAGGRLDGTCLLGV